MDSYDSWKLHNGIDDKKVVCKCDSCKEDICEDEEILYIDGDKIHEECFYDYAWKVLSPSRTYAGDE
jgi:hypothetical protein